MPRNTIIVLVVAAVLFYLYMKRKARASANGSIPLDSTWNNYQPSRFRVVGGTDTIVPIDDK